MIKTDFKKKERKLNNNKKKNLTFPSYFSSVRYTNTTIIVCGLTHVAVDNSTVYTHN